MAHSSDECAGTRRAFIIELIAAVVAVLLLVLILGWLWLRRMMRPLPTRPTQFRAGNVAEFSRPGLYKGFKESYGVWLVHQADGKLVALSTVCTHLGCTVEWVADERRFVCPCHGSQYDGLGVNIGGPTERPLERYGILRSGDEIHVEKARTFRQELGEWAEPDSFIDLRSD